MLWRTPAPRRIAQAADALATVASMAASYLLWHWLRDLFPTAPIGTHFQVTSSHYAVAALTVLVWLIALDAQKAYSSQRFVNLWTEVRMVAVTVAVGGSVVLGLMFLLRSDYLPRTLIVLFGVLNVTVLAATKALLFHVARRMRGRRRKSVLVVGAGPEACRLIETINTHFSWGLDIAAVLRVRAAEPTDTCAGVPVAGSLEDLPEALKRFNPEEVIVAISPHDAVKIAFVLDECSRMGVTARVQAGLFGNVARQVELERVLDLEILSFVFTRQSEWELVVKRLFDIVASTVALVVLSPLLLTIAILVLWQAGPPVLYRWNVVGLNRRPIRSWKFRTMVANADALKKDLSVRNEMEGPVFKLTDDPRVFPIGRFLRKYSLDELPQLVSVLKGDMSIVGPRPPLQCEFSEFDLWHRRKLAVKPGLTCLWQISGRSNITSFDDWVRLDLEYVDNWSLWLDLKIVLRTVPVVLIGTGAK